MGNVDNCRNIYPEVNSTFTELYDILYFFLYMSLEHKAIRNTRKLCALLQKLLDCFIDVMLIK